MASELPDDVELLKKIIANNEITISGKDTAIAELQKRNDLLMEQVRLLRQRPAPASWLRARRANPSGMPTGYRSGSPPRGACTSIIVASMWR